jgi:2-methylaconitate cis-trans-isomerase PrpF
LTSKVAIIGPSSRADADVDYTIGYVGIDKAVVDYQGNCGNISFAVGPFCVDEGLVPAREPFTTVRIFNTNTRKILEAEVPVRGGQSLLEGDFAIDGVPGTGARIIVNFANAAGSKTGKLLPTGRVVDTMKLSNGKTIRCSLVDVAAPAVFVLASDIGLQGTELPADTQTNPGILTAIEEIRRNAAVMMGLASNPAEAGPAIPKVAFVCAPRRYSTISGSVVQQDDCDFLARTKALSALHKAYAVTGGLCVSAAALIEGTVVHDVCGPRAKDGTVRLGHPSGVSSFLVSVEKNQAGEFELKRSATAGTARRIMDGFVYV